MKLEVFRFICRIYRIEIKYLYGSSQGIGGNYMSLEKNEVLVFTRSKEYIFKKFVGSGGTGRTVLLKDDILDKYFICKKYEPSEGNNRIDCFRRFIDEIKILYTIYNQNVVRIYNYYLYPNETTGYIIMEYVKGENIEEYLFFKDNKVFENIFIQLIEGFSYLEENSIIHRDIKPDNILVTEDGIVKIIDFGFGKKVLIRNDSEASVLLNWPVSELPEEVNNGKYNHKTDIYFLGKMFNRLLEENWIGDFKYQYIVDKMILINPNNRIDSFKSVRDLISNNILEQINFSEYERSVYTKFANSLYDNIANYSNKEPIFESNVDSIIDKLEDIIKVSSLEEYIQGNTNLIKCFITGEYSYFNKKNIEVKCVINFYKFLIAKSRDIQKVIIDNIIARLKTIETTYEDEMPF